jgi:hypothetical protein
MLATYYMDSDANVCVGNDVFVLLVSASLFAVQWT